ALVAFAVRAARADLAGNRPLLLAFTYIHSPMAVEPIFVRARVLRGGGVVLLSGVDLRQKGGGIADVELFYGSEGTPVSACSRRSEVPRPEMPVPESIPPLPHVEATGSAFHRYFDVRLAHGEFPPAGDQPSVLGGWIRPRVPMPPDEAMVLALTDVWLAPLLSRISGVAPTGVKHCTLEFVNSICGTPDAWWAFHASLMQTEAGGARMEGRLWGPSGELVVQAHQDVAEFSKP
ncbi:MAG TPA: thioesterase family protein, partial [Myxococcota bacterium]|nr:thioesterase family protein [Myxococcota bacterium]